MFNKITGSAKTETPAPNESPEVKSKAEKPNLKETHTPKVEEYVPEGIVEAIKEQPKTEPKVEPKKVEPIPPAPVELKIQNRLSKDVSITGKLKLAGDISIDGKIQGEILTKGLILIEENAVIKASINAGTVIIHGKVEGNITATDKIELFHTASVVGDLHASTLKVDSGATLSGRTSIGNVKNAAVVPEELKNSSNRTTQKPSGRSRNGS